MGSTSRISFRPFCHGISGPVKPVTLHSEATMRPYRPYRPYHRSRRGPAPVQRRSPSPRMTEMIPCTTRLLCSYTTHSVHSHLSTPHRTREGVQQPNLTVSSKHIFKLITLTLFFVPAEHALSPLDDNPRERGCDADARRRRDAALQRERQK